jgi:hypothetical protein
MSKLLLKFFNAFTELNSNSDEQQQTKNKSQNKHNDDDDDDVDDEMESKMKILTKTIVDKAVQQTESVPDHDLVGTMLLKKSKYTHDYLMTKTRY